MEGNSDFLVKFQQSLDRLGQINEIVKVNSQNRQKFVQLVRGRLNIVNEKVKEINDKIRGLKDQLVVLQKEVTENNTGIQNRDANVNRLNAQIDRLNAEKLELQNQIQSLTQNAQILQQKIDECEAQIRDLTAKNQNLTQQIEELNLAASQTGEQGAAQAATIQRMTDEHASQIEKLKQEQLAELDRLRQENEAKISQLQEIVNGCDKRISDANAQAMQIGEQLNMLTRERDDARNQVVQLQQQISQLQDQNRNLIERIVSATQVINDAMDAIQGITNDPTQQQDIEELTKSFEDVENILQQISNVIQGQQGQGNLQTAIVPQPQSQRIDSNTEVIIDNSGNTMKFMELLRGLRNKINQRPNDPNFKYRLALEEISKNVDPENILQVLRKHNIDINNGVVVGGRKTKKIRKQHGGFIYTSSSPKTRRTSRTSKSSKSGIFSNSNSSKRSSRSSKRNTDKSSYSAFFRSSAKGNKRSKKISS